MVGGVITLLHIYYMVIIMIVVECEYKFKCRSYPKKCGTCKNNKARKKEYYESDEVYVHNPCNWNDDMTSMDLSK